MNSREAFKIGFLQKCAAEGLTTAETRQRIQHAKFMLKCGAVGRTGVAGKAVDGVGGLLKSVLGAAWPVALLAPPLVGLGGGAMLAKAQDDTYDKEEARTLEEVSEYQRAIDRLKRLQARQQESMGAM